MDRGALSEAAALISTSLKNEPELLVLNKFGKLEAEGLGLRDTLSDAVQLGVPIVVGLPYRNIEQQRVFSEGLAEECPLGSPRLHEWLLLHGFHMSQKTAGAAAIARTANIY